MKFYHNPKTDELLVVTNDGLQYPFTYTSRVETYGTIERFKSFIQLRGTYHFKQRPSPADLSKGYIEL